MKEEGSPRRLFFVCPRMVRGGLKSRKFSFGLLGPSTAAEKTRKIGGSPPPPTPSPTLPKKAEGGCSLWCEGPIKASHWGGRLVTL